MRGDVTWDGITFCFKDAITCVIVGGTIGLATLWRVLLGSFFCVFDDGTTMRNAIKVGSGGKTWFTGTRAANLGGLGFIDGAGYFGIFCGDLLGEDAT